MYLFSLRFVKDLSARSAWPLSFRLIIQPVVAVLLGLRDGRRDAKAGTPPFVFDLLLQPKDRSRAVKSAMKTMLKPLIVGVLLDCIAQYLMVRQGALERIYPVPALIVALGLMGVPYALARGLANRVATRRRSRAGRTCHPAGRSGQ